MEEQKSRAKLIIYALLLAVLFIGLIFVFKAGHGNFLRLELAGLLFLLLLTIIGFVGYAQHWGEWVLFWVFLLYIGNLVLLWYFQGSLYLVLLLIAVVGFVVSVPKGRKPLPKLKPEVQEQHSMVFPEKTEPKKTEAKSATKFTPGKFVASKRSNVYHEPKCDWAKKIAKEHQVWFASKEEAWEKGFKGHDCVV